MTQTKPSFTYKTKKKVAETSLLALATTFELVSKLAPELKDELINTLNQKHDFNGFTIPRRNYIGSTWVKHCGWYPDYKTRLVRRGSSK